MTMTSALLTPVMLKPATVFTRKSKAVVAFRIARVRPAVMTDAKAAVVSVAWAVVAAVKTAIMFAKVKPASVARMVSVR